MIDQPLEQEMGPLATAGAQHRVDRFEPLAGFFGILVLDVLDVGHWSCLVGTPFREKSQQRRCATMPHAPLKDARDDPVLAQFGQASGTRANVGLTPPQAQLPGC